MDLRTKQSKASKGPSVHKCPISLGSTTQWGKNMLAYLAHNNMRNLTGKSLHFLSQWLSRKRSSNFQKLFMQMIRASSSIIILFPFTASFLIFFPFWLLTQNWKEHANVQLITNVCCPFLQFTTLFLELFSSFLFLTPLWLWSLFCILQLDRSLDDVRSED